MNELSFFFFLQRTKLCSSSPELHVKTTVVLYILPPQQRAWEAQHNIPQEVFVFDSQREQVLASDKKRTCFANNQSDLKPRVKTEVSVVCSFGAARQLQPGSVQCLFSGEGGKQVLGFPFPQEDLSPKAHSPPVWAHCFVVLHC